MKNIMKYFCLAFFASVLVSNVAGCKALHPTANTTTKTVESDSTSTKITERYVIVKVPGDTVMMEHWIECPEASSGLQVLGKPKPKPFKQIMKGQRSDGVIEINDAGKLMAIFNCNQWKDSVKVRDTEIARLKSYSKTDSTRIEIPVRYIPKAYKAAMWFSWAVIALVVGWCVYSAVKLYLKLKPF